MDDVAGFGGQPRHPNALDRLIAGSEPDTVAFLAASFLLSMAVGTPCIGQPLVVLLVALAVMHRGADAARVSASRRPVKDALFEKWHCADGLRRSRAFPEPPLV